MYEKTQKAENAVVMRMPKNENTGSDGVRGPMPQYEFVDDDADFTVIARMNMSHQEVLDTLLKKDKEDELLKTLQQKAAPGGRKVTPVKPGSTVDYKPSSLTDSWQGSSRS